MAKATRVLSIHPGFWGSRCTTKAIFITSGVRDIHIKEIDEEELLVFPLPPNAFQLNLNVLKPNPNVR